MDHTLKKKYKSVAVLYHLRDEGRSPEDTLGHISRYAEHLTDHVDYFLTPENEFPVDQSLEAYDLVFIAGGPGKVFGDDLDEWMIREIAMVTDAVHRKQKVIGICLGAQMLAMIMGATVKKNDHFERGFHSVRFHTEEGNPVLKNIPNSEIFWHYHHYGFHTPIDALEIAVSDASLAEDHGDYGKGSQGFVTENVLALQFHPEITPETVDIVSQNLDDIEDKYTQSKELITMLSPLYTVSRDNDEENCARNVFFKLIDNFLLLH